MLLRCVQRREKQLERHNATLTLGRIFLRIWIFEIRGEFAQNLRIDSEYFHVRPRSPFDLSEPICYEFLRMLNNASQWLPMPYNSLRKLPTLTHALPTLPMATNAYENLRRMTVFATFAEIKKRFPMLFHTVANNIRVNVLTNENIWQSLILRNIRRVFVSVRNKFGAVTRQAPSPYEDQSIYKPVY